MGEIWSIKRVRAALLCLGNRYTKGDALMGELISTFPLYLVTNDDLGLLGSRVRAQRCLMSSNAQL